MTGIDLIRSSAVNIMMHKSSKEPIVSDLIDEGGPVLDLILMFVDKLPDMLSEIRELFYHSEWEILSLKIHSLKGTGGNFGFYEITELASCIEESMTKKDHEGIEELLAQLDVLKQRIDAGVSSYKKISG